ncbi:hypothetical protein FEM03_21740 [Phragmitibacter flavus]|uniref:Uncharacterized protein n=1 Tax=Phragmitibacter flavus TaxID=2576071 RepID=A0A5R8K8M6_9BACT|nr:hypothetical protein [Phragmitibacter flavus]TLD68663.1 hypothetical protein FEM03_21740 [Phragmitibacter flavus]
MPFTIKIKAAKASGNGAFLGVHGIPTSGVYWCLSSKPDYSIRIPAFQSDYGELLKVARKICRNHGGWVFVVDENDTTLVAEEWVDGGEIEPEMAGHWVRREHEAAGFREV